MDKNELERRERWAELAASIAQADRNIEAKARRHRTLRFWFSPWQVVDEPVAADVTPGEPHEGTPASHALGVTSGEADSEPTTAVSHTPAVGGFVGPAGPTTPHVRPVRGTGPATPPLDASLATRTSAGNWT